MSGEIPATLGKLTNLEYLNLGQNKLSGEIPATLGKLTNLEYLNLGQNELSEEIPATLGGLASLTHLLLSENRLTGEIPVTLGGLTNLMHLLLSENRLTGEIPAALGGLTSLDTLWVEENSLSGEIPPELGRLTNLTMLDLRSNGLTGEIPAALGRITALTQLDLRGNDLVGDAPRHLRALEHLTRLSLDDSVSLRRLTSHQQHLAGLAARSGNEDATKLIVAGESKTVEFKQTLRGLRGDGKPEHAALKSIAGLLNTDGGHLFIGIRNNGEACGIEEELEKRSTTEDGMLLWLADVIENRMTDGAWNRVHPEFHMYGGRRILVIRCDQSPEPVILEEGEGEKRVERVYARTGPKTQELKGFKKRWAHFNSRTLRSATTEPSE